MSPSQVPDIQQMQQDDNFSGLSKALSYPQDAAIRANAAEALGKILSQTRNLKFPSTQIAQDLIQAALRDEDETVRVAASRAVYAGLQAHSIIKSPFLVRVAQHLTDRDLATRQWALEHLTFDVYSGFSDSTGYRAVLAITSSVLKNTDTALKIGLINEQGHTPPGSIWDVKPSESRIKWLFAQLKSRNVELRTLALNVLLRHYLDLPFKQRLNLLKRITNGKNVDYQLALGERYAEFCRDPERDFAPDYRVSRAMLKLLDHPDQVVRLAALKNLEVDLTPRTITRLAPYLYDPDMREVVLHTLITHPLRMSWPNAVNKPFFPMLESPDAFTRQSACQILACTGDEAAIEPLLNANLEPIEKARAIKSIYTRIEVPQNTKNLIFDRLGATAQQARQSLKGIPIREHTDQRHSSHTDRGGSLSRTHSDYMERDDCAATGYYEHQIEAMRQRGELRETYHVDTHRNSEGANHEDKTTSYHTDIAAEYFDL